MHKAATELEKEVQSTPEPKYGQGLDSPIFSENAVKNLKKDSKIQEVFKIS